MGSRYQIIGELDRGGMANVYLCVAGAVTDFAKLHVLKCLKDDMRDDKLVTMFLDEGRVATRLNHPNVVQTFDVGRDADRYFIAMEYLEGQSLAKLLRTHERSSGEPLARDIHLRILCEAMRGLDYAHDLKNFDGAPLNIVHRDVSPQNIFITYQGAVKVIDFGIAKAALTVSSTEAGTMKGKASYIAPEQAIGAAIDRRVDVFAMGMLLWGAAVGRPMWRTEPDIQRLTEILTAKLKMPRDVDPTVPLALHDIVVKALKRSSSERYGSMSELRNAVEEYLRAHEPAAKPDERERVLGRLFADERNVVERAIRKHMAKMASGARTRPLRITHQPGSELVIESMVDVPASVSSSPSDDVEAPPPASGRRPTPSETPVAMPIPEIPPPALRRGPSTLLLAGALGLVAAVGVSIFTRTHQPRAAAAAPVAPVVQIQAPAAAPVPAPAPAPIPTPAPTPVVSVEAPKAPVVRTVFVAPPKAAPKPIAPPPVAASSSVPTPTPTTPPPPAAAAAAIRQPRLDENPFK